MFIKQITNQALRFVLLALVSLTFSVKQASYNKRSNPI